jgi:predicted DNA-binding transcriptional regulator YafY
MADDVARWRTIHPHAMVIRGGQWYLIAKNVEVNELHQYRLDRLLNLRVTPTLENFYEDSWSVFRGTKHTVKLRIEGKAIRILRERYWIDQVLEHTDKNEAICTLTVQGTEEILTWALSMAPNVTILEPKALKEQMEMILEATLKKVKSTDRT